MDNPKQVLIYDVNSVPSGAEFDMEKIMYFYKEHQALFYDSHAGGQKPEVINISDIEVSFIDVSKEEGMKKWNNYKEKLK